MRYSILLVLALGCAPFPKGDKVPMPTGPIPTDHAETSDAAVAVAVENLVGDFIRTQKIPGVGIALVNNGSVCYSGGIGWADVETERGLGNHTPVLLSSVTKTFIGVAAMQGVEAGRLTLDDKVTKHVPFDVDNPKVEGEIITLRDLLTHNSGIEDSLAYAYSYVEGDPTVPLGHFLEEYLTKKGDYWQPRNFYRRMPGEAFEYTNVGASLGAYAIGQAAGLEFMDLVDQDILTPLGMEDSAFLLADLTTEPAVPYSNNGPQLRPWPHYGYPTYPDGMMHSSASDIGRYIAAIGGGGSLDGQQILTAERVDEMLTIDASAGTDEDGQAVIWTMRKLDGQALYGHNGGDFGSETEIWLDPKTGAGFAVLMNAPPRDWDALIALEVALYALATACAD